MLRYFDEMRDVLERHGGTVEKFIGDAVMAVFGVPVVHEDDALRAVRAADEMRARARAAERRARASARRAARWRIGINTGEVVVGDPSAHADDRDRRHRQRRRAPPAGGASPGEILLGRETYRLVARPRRGGAAGGVLAQGQERGRSRRGGSSSVHERAAGMLRRLDSPFVGREAERALLERAYRATVEESGAGSSRSSAPPGIGKSRLAQECISRLLSARRCCRDAACRTARGSRSGRSRRSCAERALGSRRTTRPTKRARRSRSCCRPGEESALVCERVAARSGCTARRRGPRSPSGRCAGCFESIARARPLVLVFEDMHWAEPTLLDLLEYLVGWSSGAPILLLCLARPELRRRAAAARPGDAIAARAARGGRDRARSPRTSSARGRLDPAVVSADRRGGGRQPALRRGDRAHARRRGRCSPDEDGVWSATAGPRRARRCRRRSTRCSRRGSTGSTPDEREVHAVRVGRRQGVLVGLGRGARRAASFVRRRRVAPARARAQAARSFPASTTADHRARTRSASATSSCATPPTRRCRRGGAPRCTSATPSGCSRRPAIARRQLEEIVGYHLEQAFAARARARRRSMPPRAALAARAAGAPRRRRAARARARRHRTRPRVSCGARRHLDDGRRRRARTGARHRAHGVGSADRGGRAPVEGDRERAGCGTTSAAKRTRPWCAPASGSARIRPGRSTRRARWRRRRSRRSRASTTTRGLAQALRLLSATHGWHSEWEAMSGGARACASSTPTAPAISARSRRSRCG